MWTYQGWLCCPFWFSTIFSWTYFSLSFVESSNISVQNGQMDIIIWFWDSQTNCVVTHYLGWEFMGRSTAEDVLQTFLAGISDLDQSKILQVASNSPNVNLLFLKNLSESQDERELLPFLDIGRCGLHVIHGRFKTGEKRKRLRTWKTIKGYVEVSPGSSNT